MSTTGATPERVNHAKLMAWNGGANEWQDIKRFADRLFPHLVRADERIVLEKDLDTVTTTLLSWADDDIGGELLAAVNRIRAAIGTQST